MNHPTRPRQPITTATVSRGRRLLWTAAAAAPTIYLLLETAGARNP